MKDITKPTVHLNGTSAESLMEGYESAARKLGEAFDAVAATAPNARDYYVQGDSAYERARSEHADRVTKLRELMEEISQLYFHVEEQKDARARG